MKFVVNRVSNNSAHQQSSIQGRGVCIDTIEESVCSHGFVSGKYTYPLFTCFCSAFTIAEIDDEGYLM